MTKRICVSVDVEEDFPGFVKSGRRGVEEGIPELLRLLEDVHVPADFFFQSSIVTEHPDLVSRIAKSKHGIGNHGLNHAFLSTKPPAVQKEEIRRSTRILENVFPQEPRMFRAAGFSTNLVTLEILQDLGYAIDSSILPGRRAKRFRVLPAYDHRAAPRDPHFPVPSGDRSADTRLLEIPVTENPLRRGGPLGLGAINAYGFDKVMTALHAVEERTLVFLVHPWELIDARAYYPKVPEGLLAACSGDLGAFRDFLTAARAVAEFSTLPNVRREFLGG